MNEYFAQKSARRVAWLMHGNEGYGVQRSALAMTAALRRRGWEITFVCLEDGVMADVGRRHGLKVATLGVERPPGFGGGLVEKISAVRAGVRFNKTVSTDLGELLETLKVGALQVRIPTLVALAGSAAEHAGIPCVWHMASVISSRYPMQLNRLYYQWVSWRYGVSVLGNSKYTAESFGNWPVRAKVLYLGVEATQFDPQVQAAVTRPDLGIPEDAVVFGIFARLIESKGQRTFLEAMARVEEADNLFLVCIGGEATPNYRSQLLDSATKYGLSDRIRFIGRVEDPAPYYNIIDIAVNAFRGAEAFGLSVVEAMLMGKPVLAHALGGPGETVLDGATGWHVADPSAEEFARGIRRVLRDRVEWPCMGSAARERASRMFVSDVAAQNYEQLLESIIRVRQRRVKNRERHD